MVDTVDNVAETIFVEAVERINRVVAAEPDNRALARHLILTDLWEQITAAIGFGPKDLREKADEIEEDWEENEEDDEDEEAQA